MLDASDFRRRDAAHARDPAFALDIASAFDVACAFVLLTLAVWRLGWQPVIIPAGYLAAVTATLGRMDVATHRLPNALVLPGLGFVLVGALIARTVDGVDDQLSVNCLALGAASFALLLAIQLVGAIGMGDVKLGTVLAATLGLLPPTAVPLAVAAAIFMATTFAGMFAVVALLQRRHANRAWGGPETAGTHSTKCPPRPVGDVRHAPRLPLGPFLLAGFWLGLLSAAQLPAASGPPY